VSNNAWEGQIRHEPDTPTGISAAIGAGVVVVAAFLSAAVPPSAGDVRLGVLALALAGFAALTVDPRAVAAVDVLAFLVFDGFLVNQLGELSWHGQADQTRLVILAGAGTAGVAVGAAYRGVRRRRVWRRRSEWVAAQVADAAASRDEQRAHTEAMVWTKEEARRA
jgi:hypothetical protein